MIDRHHDVGTFELVSQLAGTEDDHLGDPAQARRKLARLADQLEGPFGHLQPGVLGEHHHVVAHTNSPFHEAPGAQQIHNLIRHVARVAGQHLGLTTRLRAMHAT